jgi:hypothetical protein
MADKESIPAFKTPEECRVCCEEKRDNFYLDVFLFEAWTGATPAR